MPEEILTDFMDAFPEVDSFSVRIYPEPSKSKLARNGFINPDTLVAESITEKYGNMVSVEVVDRTLFVRDRVYAKITKNGADSIYIVRGPHSATELLERLEEVMK